MAIEHTLESPLAHAVRAAGGQSAFARLIKRSQPYVHGLLRDGKQLPAEETVLVDAADIGFTKAVLRPDLFGAERPDNYPHAPASTAGPGSSFAGIAR